MSRYRMKNCECRAEVVDNNWLLFLTKERKIASVTIGDYWVTCLDGREELWPKERFENIFYKLPESS